MATALAVLQALVALAGLLTQFLKWTEEEKLRQAGRDEAIAQGNAVAHEAEAKAVEAAAEAKEEVEKLQDSELDQVGREMGILRD